MTSPLPARRLIIAVLHENDVFQMKKCALLGVMLLSGSIAFAQADPTLLTIDGQPVRRSEFEYYYNKNTYREGADKMSVATYLEMFVDYKLKVQAALDAHLDTLDDFKRAYAAYHSQPIEFHASDSGIEQEAYRMYEEEKKLAAEANEGLVRAAHILVRLSQNASPMEEVKAKARIDSVYEALLKGADFGDMAREYSDDAGSAAQGGLLPWMRKGQSVMAFERVAYGLGKGEVSKPFLAEFGYHIIKLVDKRIFLPYDSLASDLYRRADMEEIRKRIQTKHLSLEISPVQDETMAKGWAARELRDDLLFEFICNKMVWEKVEKDEKMQQRFFAENRKRYRWTQPRFKGMAFYAKNAADAKAVKRCVKGMPFEQWASLLEKTFNKGGEKHILVETDVFKVGDNSLVDKQKFKKGNSLKPVKGYPVASTYGKLLKKGPAAYTDVKALVVADCQELMEKEWVKTLRGKYDVVVNKQVLATINKH